MSRVKRGTIKAKTRRSTLKQVKGYNFGRSTKKKQAKEAIMHAGAHAFDHRRDKKGDFRRLWQIKIGAAVKPLGLSYSKFIGGLKKKEIALDRKVLADMAEHNPEAFSSVVDQVK